MTSISAEVEAVEAAMTVPVLMAEAALMALRPLLRREGAAALAEPTDPMGTLKLAALRESARLPPTQRRLLAAHLRGLRAPPPPPEATELAPALG